MGSLVISERTFSHVQEMASTESNTGVMIEGNYSAEKAKKHQFTQHFYQKVISCRLCAEKLAFQKQKFDDESAVYRLKKKSVRFDFSCAPAWSQHCHNIVPAYLCVRQKSAHLLVSPRQQHTGVLAKSLILIFYEGTQRQALEYLPCKSTAYHINYSAGK